MMEKLFRHILIVLFVLLVWHVQGNNIKISDEIKIIDFPDASTAVVEFTVSWENSWRDDLNWDAAWVFLKYRKRGETEQWHHVCLSGAGHLSETQYYDIVPASTGSRVMGVFVVRENNFSGNATAKIRLRWNLTGNTEAPLSAVDFGAGKDGVYVMAYATEMVYVPYGPYYLGDGTSKGGFASAKLGNIPEINDIIGTSNYTYSASATGVNTSVQNPADHINNSKYVSATNHNGWTAGVPNAWWMVDFKEAKRIKYFGVSGLSNVSGARPATSWYLEGSNNTTTWEILWSGTPELWSTKEISYPVQQAIRVPQPADYRYYRIRTIDSERGTDCWITNVAMTEDDIYLGVSTYCLIDGEERLDAGAGLYASDTCVWTGNIPAAYPKGYKGFYCMKYEVSQEQYVDFLNTLTLQQQKKRIGNNNFTGMHAGQYVLGGLDRPASRNGIAILNHTDGTKPVVFGNNLNPENPFFEADDGQMLPCNYMCIADMMAWCDWAGLRPMSEMEYEKASRDIYPRKPLKGEYAWNTNASVNKIELGINSLRGVNTKDETPSDYRKNVNSGAKVDGPVRCGAFATTATNQLYSGATQWGIMEMSGNLWEVCYNANFEGRKFRTDDPAYAHGDGKLGDDGDTDVPYTYWPKPSEAFALRGGGFGSPEDQLRTSDRTFAVGNYSYSITYREKELGFRGVRSIIPDTRFTAGRIYCQNGTLSETLCDGTTTYKIEGEAPVNTTGKLTYIWYLSKDNGTTWNIIEGQSGVALYYTQFDTPTPVGKKYMFKRKAVCLVGDKTSEPVTISISSPIDKPVITNNFSPLWGSSLVLPAPAATGQTIYWIFPDGTKHMGATTISNFGGAYEGDYYAYYINTIGCESDRVKITIKGKRPLITQGAYRVWADGTLARSVAEYRNPPAPYVYSGSTGNGIYRIDPDGSGSGAPINVYCYMDSYSGTSQPVVCLNDQNGVRLWGNGTYARSVKDYRNPASGYAYAGATGNAVYRIDPDASGSGAPINVYCYMDSYSGTSQPVVCLNDQNGVRLWGDGSNAASVIEYRNGKTGYVYAGATGNAVYRINASVGGTLDLYAYMTSYSGTAHPLVRLNSASGPCLWGNGSYAVSADKYKNPSSGYSYTGSVGDGVYRVDPDGNGSVQPFDVYCDMTTNGGGWMLVMMGATNSVTFNFVSAYWTNDALLNETQTNPSANQDMKNKAYLYCPLSQIFIRMRLSDNNKSMDFFESQSRSNCKALFTTLNTYISSKYTIDQIVSNYDLDKLYGYRWQRGEPLSGLSISGGYQGGIHVRYGIISNQTGENNATHDSEIGIGTTLRSAGAHALVNDNNAWVTGDFGGSFWLYIK